MSNNAKKNTLKHPENTNKTCFEAFWEILENPILGSKMWSSAQISNYAKIPWYTQKTPTKHVLRLFKKFLKIRFSAQKSGSRPRCRTMLKKCIETLRKHQLNMFWGFLRNFWKSGSRLKNPVLDPDVEQCEKYFETLRKHQLNTLWGILRNFWKSDSWLKNPVLGSYVE